MENEEEGGSISSQEERGRIANEAVAAAAAGEEIEQDTGNHEVSMDVEDTATDVATGRGGNGARHSSAEEAKSSEIAAAASEEGDCMDIDVKMTAADDGNNDCNNDADDNEDDGDERKMPAVAKPSSIGGTADVDMSYMAAASAMMVDDGDVDGAVEEKKEYTEENDRKPSANADGNGSPIPAAAAIDDAIRRTEYGNRLCYVDECSKIGRRESGWMCGEHFRELRDRDPAAAAAAKAAANPTPRHQQSKKKKLVSSAEVSSLFDGQNGGIELAPRRSKRKNPNDANAEANGGEMGGRYPARKRARTDQQQSMQCRKEPAEASKPAKTLTLAAGTAAATRDGNVRQDNKGSILCAVEGCSKRSRSESGYMCLAHFRFCNEKGCAPADLEVHGDEETVIIHRSASRPTSASSKSGRGDKNTKNSPSSATAKSPPAKASSTAKLPTLSSEIRRNSHGNRYCAVENCSKLAKSSKTNWMCKTHFDEFHPSATENSQSGGTSSKSTRPAPTSSSAASSSSLVKVVVKIGGKREDSGTAEAQLPVPLAPPPKKKKATRAKLDYDKLEPLGKPAELPTPPNTGKCQWSFERSSRVLLAKFSLGKDEKMHPTDYEYLTKMMERDDLSVVSEGLANDLNPSLWNFSFIDGLAREEWCHRVRRFSRQIVPESDLVQDSSAAKITKGDSVSPKYFVTHKEEEKNVSMKLSCLFQYLAKRTACLEHIASIREAKGLDPLRPTGPDDRVGRAKNDEELFEFTSHDGKECSVNVVDDVLYLIDYDMEKLLPPLREDFSKAFKAPAFLPGGEECMMNNINTNGRPSMGPNSSCLLYRLSPGRPRDGR